MCLRTNLYCIYLIVLSLCLKNQSVLSSSCGGKLTWGEMISVPRDSDGNYKNNLHCAFDAKFATDISPNVIQVSWFGSFDIAGKMPTCNTDYLEIFVSCSYKSIGRFCGRKKPSDVISPDRCLKMVFHSDNSVTGRGFKARLIVTASPRNLAHLHNYRHVVKLNSSSGSGLLASPGYPRHYPARCPSQTFLFETTQKGTAMRLYFMEFDTKGTDGICESHTDDILTIKVSKFDKDNNVRCLCGVRKPFILSWSEFTRIDIKFTTNNDSFVSRGFVAGYIIYQLTGIATGNIGVETFASLLLVFLCLLALRGL
ncbi:CUB domain-containing protein 2-like [Oculina patagonica]